MAGAESKVERYELTVSLGEGGQGSTHEALDRQTGRRVAVKVFHLRGASGWKPYDLFARECRVLEALDHPGIPKYLDTYADEAAGKYFLVMELVEGASLQSSLKRQEPFGEAQLWNILHQAMVILAYLHGLHPPVIHRDLKPANLIRRPDNRLALVDFGGVRVALQQDGGSTVVGTYGYMAPEQLRGEATPATDIYGLGMTLLALAAGTEADRLPHKGLRVDVDQVLRPGKLRDLLRRMVEPEPGERLDSVEAVRRALDAAGRAAGPAAGAPWPAGAPRPPEPPRPPMARMPPAPGTESPFFIVLRIIGGLGYVGLSIIDAILLPLLFMLVGAAWASDEKRRARLRARQEMAHRGLLNARDAFKALIVGQEGERRKALGGRKGRRRRELPPHGRGRW